MIKNLNVNAYQIALGFKKGALVKIYEEGNYWISMFQNVSIFEKNKPFNAPIELDLLLQNKDLAEKLNVYKILEGQIGLKFKNGLLKEVLKPGTYAYWKFELEENLDIMDLNSVAIAPNLPSSLYENPLMFSYIRKFVIENYQKGLLYINNDFVEELKSGVYYWWKNSIPIHVAVADMRIQNIDISGQELMTKDKIMIRINFNARFQVSDLEKAINRNKEYEKQFYSIMQLALREWVGGYTLDELLANKNEAEKYVKSKNLHILEEMGLQLIDCGLKDIILPGEIKEIINQVLIAEKKAQANIIMRREETASMRSMLNTAKLMEENPTLWKLKEMEYVEKISEKIGEITLSGNGNMLEQLKGMFGK